MFSLLNIPNSNFNSLYIPCITNKHTQIVIQSKSITEVKEKFDEMHVDL